MFGLSFSYIVIVESNLPRMPQTSPEPFQHIKQIHINIVPKSYFPISLPHISIYSSNLNNNNLLPCQV